LSNIQATLFSAARFPPYLPSRWRISPTVPVLVVGEGLDDERRAAGTVAFVRDFLVRHTRQLAGAPLNGALDVVGGHVHRLGLGHDRAQPRVAVDVAAAGPRRHVSSLMMRVKTLPRLASARPSCA
jgi:hypothetical protein